MGGNNHGLDVSDNGIGALSHGVRRIHHRYAVVIAAIVR